MWKLLEYHTPPYPQSYRYQLAKTVRFILAHAVYVKQTVVLNDSAYNTTLRESQDDLELE